VAKAHGGPIEIYGVTVATVDDKVRLQTVDTWFDPLEMFRQIAPGGIVNKTVMNRKVDMETALDDDAIVGKPNGVPEASTTEQPKEVATESTKSEETANTSTDIKGADQVAADPTDVPAAHFANDGVKIAEQHNKEGAEVTAPEDIIPKHISNSTGEPADAFVPHQGADTTESAVESDQTDPSPAQTLVDAAATHGAAAEIEHPESNFHDSHEVQPQADTGAAQETPVAAETNDSSNDNKDLPTPSIYASPVNGNPAHRLALGASGAFPDESRSIRDAVDEHLEGPSADVHPHPKDMEESVRPKAGEAVAVEAGSEETRVTHEEMSGLRGGECPFLMNRE